jgi:hypothetical protein
MNEPPRDEQSGAVSTTPFDDYSGSRENALKRRPHLAPLAGTLRIVSGLVLIFAFGSAAAIILLDAVHWARPELAFRIKSALPLIGIGVSYALLQITLPRTWTELCLGFAVSAAFILWGLEQYLPAAIASHIDDVVVFLFVLDLAIVIRGRLAESLGGKGK